jgi:hypothetical protein
MKVSRDAWILIAVLMLFGFVVYYVAVGSAPGTDTPSSYATGKRGTKAFYLLLGELGFRVGRHSRPLSNIPPDAHVLFLVDPPYVADRDVRPLARWVKKGNALVLAVSSLEAVPSELGVRVVPRGFPTAASVRPERGRYSTGVKRVRVGASLSVRWSRRNSVIIKDDEGIVAAEHPLGKGHVIVFGDPRFLSNSMIGEEDNSVLLTNLVYEHAPQDSRVLFAEYDEILARREGSAPPVLGRGGKLALAQVLFAALFILISAGRRFGAIHPLPERVGQRRGWEFVRAMAGLYRRAEAREAALTAIHRSFRRELALRFGVADSATPGQAAETILRARQADRARLTALLSRCDQIAAGSKTSDAEIVALSRTIEECRRELGIARSTND